MTQPHTPGPWHVEQQNEGRPLIRSEDGTEICEVIGETFDEYAEEEREATAQLIAAAPELLAALVDLVRSVNCSDRSSWLHDEAEKARAAIVKAQGEA